MIGLALMLAYALSDPCAEATPACRCAARNAIITWRTEAEICEARRLALEAMLDVRTATAAAIVHTEHVALEAEDSGASFETVVAVGAVALAVGVAAGVVGTLALKE